MVGWPLVVKQEGGSVKRPRRGRAVARSGKSAPLCAHQQRHSEAEQREAELENDSARAPACRDRPLRPLSSVDLGIERVVEEHPAFVKGRAGQKQYRERFGAEG